MQTLHKPKPLAPGSRVAVVAPSWGGPGTVPNRYEMGVRELEERFGFTVVEMPHTRAADDWLWAHPQARAADLNAAFADPTIDGIIAAIGGDDSIRILPYVDTSLFARHPKAFMGYSDTTTLHVLALLHGLQTFYGPSVMAGIAESGGTLPYTESWIRRTLMSTEPVGDVTPAEEWTEAHERWEETRRDGPRRAMQPNPGWTWQGGTQRVEGHLVGGCLDVLEFLKGTRWWPGLDVWDGAVFYWETSEDAPSPTYVKYWLRNYGAMGVLERLAGMLVGRPNNYTPEQRAALPEVIHRVVAEEYGRPDLPIALDLDFGHTYPQMALPNGGRVILDPATGRITLPDAPTQV